MVSYGDRGFREWAEELELNDADLRLVQRTAGFRALLWFLIPQSLCFLAFIPGQESWATVGPALFVLFFQPFFVFAWTTYKCVKQGTFDHVRPGLILGLFSFCMVISYIFIIPLIMRLFNRKQFGSGIRGLIKKGKIGNG